MTILDTDLLNEDIDLLPYTQVVATIVDGHEVYKAPVNSEIKKAKQELNDFVNELLYSERYD